jgi:hypothetical protein
VQPITPLGPDQVNVLLFPQKKFDIHHGTGALQHLLPDPTHERGGESQNEPSNEDYSTNTRKANTYVTGKPDGM